MHFATEPNSQTLARCRFVLPKSRLVYQLTSTAPNVLLASERARPDSTQQKIDYVSKLFLEASRLMLRQLASRVSAHSKTLLFFYPDLTK